MRAIVTFLALGLLVACTDTTPPETAPPEPPSSDPVMKRLSELVLRDDPTSLTRDVTNTYADDERAAELGKKFFFEKRFSGPLLDDANDGLSQTLGEQGQVDRVSCAGCHVPEEGAFVDTRTERGQISLGAGWTKRRTPTVLDLGTVRLLTWDGRRDTAYSIVFGVIENPVEFNSSRLYVAQQIARLYKDAYEEVFGPLPSLDGYDDLSAETAGCVNLPHDPFVDRCDKPGEDDPDVTRIVVNMGKAIQAYTRKLSCGPARFDAWVQGEGKALTKEEEAGARLFVKSGCIDCHSGPHFTDLAFHNVGVKGGLMPFSGIDTRGDRGAIDGLAAVRDDWLNSRGPFSDGDDGRLDAIAEDLAALEGAFRTPTLRCIGGQKAFMHNGMITTLQDLMRHFNDGGATTDTLGVSEIEPLGLSTEEMDQIIAFLGTLDGSRPDASLRAPPKLP